MNRARSPPPRGRAEPWHSRWSPRNAPGAGSGGQLRGAPRGRGGGGGGGNALSSEAPPRTTCWANPGIPVLVVTSATDGFPGEVNGVASGWKGCYQGQWKDITETVVAVPQLKSYFSKSGLFAY